MQGEISSLALFAEVGDEVNACSLLVFALNCKKSVKTTTVHIRAENSNFSRLVPVVVLLQIKTF